MMTPQSSEKFSAEDMEALRNDLLQSGLDSFQAGELIAAFLAARGYGVSHDDARDAAARVEGARCNMAIIQQELEQLAMAM